MTKSIFLLLKHLLSFRKTATKIYFQCPLNPELWMATAQTFKVNTIAIWRGCLLVTKNAINSNILDPWPVV